MDESDWSQHKRSVRMADASKPDFRPTDEELQTEHFAADYLEWVVKLIDGVCVSKEGTSAYRLGEGTLKELKEEAYAIGLIGVRHFESSPNVVMQLVLGNQEYDAVVTDNRSNPSPVRYLEITQAHEGEDGYLRTVALEDKGFVCGIGPVHKQGTKNTGLTVSVESTAASSVVVRDEGFARIKAAADRKRNNRPRDGTALVITFEDRVTIDKTHEAEDMRLLDEFLRAKVLGDLHSFRWVSVVGTFGRYLEYDMQSDTSRRWVVRARTCVS